MMYMYGCDNDLILASNTWLYLQYLHQMLLSMKRDLSDSDNDGFSSDEDCDDSSTHGISQLTEICDGIDNDCSGEIDDGVKGIYYPDEDGDGFGDNNNPTEFLLSTK